MIYSARNGRSIRVWEWGDSEIENPRLLREHIKEIHARGFTEVLITLGESRYETMDPKVIRAITQVSQWAKARGLRCWVHTDPRRASRTITSQTGERLQCLLLPSGSTEKMPVVPDVSGHYEITFSLSGFADPWESSPFPRLDPIGIEKVFLFQMEEGRILRDTLIDITPTARFFIDSRRDVMEIFGEVGVPEKETWFVLPFPRCNTHLYDPVSRQNLDALYRLAEAFFDGAAYLDGLMWDSPPLRHPDFVWVSESIYNAFRAEYGYALKEYLFALAFEVDDGSHVQVRLDYAYLLTDGYLEASLESGRYFHTFFGELERSISVFRHQETLPEFLPPRLNDTGFLEHATTAIDMLCWENSHDEVPAELLTRLIFLRSLGALMRSQAAYASIVISPWSKKQYAYALDLLAFFSIHWMDRPRRWMHPDEVPSDKDFITWNDRLDAIEEKTGFRFPEPQALVVIPWETLWGVSIEVAREIWATFCKFISRLTQHGLVVDILPSLWAEGLISSEKGFMLGKRSYPAVILLYPHVITIGMDRFLRSATQSSFPILLGGLSPSYLTTGETLSNPFPIAFDPEVEDLTPLFQAGIRPTWTAPQGTFAVEIVHMGDRFLLVMPGRPNGILSGELVMSGHHLFLEGIDRLALFGFEEKGFRRLL